MQLSLRKRFPASSSLVQAGSSFSPARPFFLLPPLPQGPRGELGVGLAPKYIQVLEPSNLSKGITPAPQSLAVEGNSGPSLRGSRVAEHPCLSACCLSPAEGTLARCRPEPKPPTPPQGPGRGPLLALPSASGIH